MAAIWMRARHELRRGWRSALALGLLVGILAGGSIAAAAGARRTQTAYPRFLERYGVFHANVASDEKDLDEIARIPQVRALVPTRLFFGRVSFGAITLSFPDVFLIAGMIPPGAPNSTKLLDGAFADQSATDQVEVSYALAERLEIDPGDVMTGAIFAPSPEGPPREQPIRVRVAGIGVQPGGFETLTGRGFPNVIAFTRAFGERYRDLADIEGGAVTGVSLRRGAADLESFTRELRVRGIQTDGPPTPTTDFTEDVQELNRLPAVVLWSLSAFLALAALAIVGQAISRETLIGAGDHATLRALGISRRGLFAVAMVRAISVAAVGAIAAVGVAVLASPLMPVGIARVAEPDPGFAADVVALAIGAAATLVVVAATGAFPAWRSSALVGEHARRVGRRSRVAEGLARASAPPAAVAGVRMALEPGHGASAVPVRSATIGAAIAIAAVAAALVFATSLDNLLDDPRLTGYAWDAAVVLSEPGTIDEVEAALPRDIVERTWKGTVFPLIDAGGLTITAFVSDGPPPSIIDGRPPQGLDEIALDPTTLKRLDKEIGDRVVAQDASETGGGPEESTSPRELRIVGTLVVPRLPFQPNENAAQGAALTPEALQLIDPFEFETVQIKFRAEAEIHQAIDRVKEATADVAFVVFTPQQLGAVRNLQRISILPSVAAGLLAAVAIATVAHTLVSTARRRRGDLAILKAIGFVGRQVRATVAWQATSLAVAAIALGVPVGAAAGRWAWRLFAHEITVVSVPVVSVASLVGMVPIIVVLVNLIAAFPARAAARTKPALVLRTE